MYSFHTAQEREKELIKLAPHRERALANLKTMRKKRIDHKTEVLIK